MREAIQQESDEAVFQRRALAVEKERAIAENELALQRIVAITSPDNVASIKVLNKLGLRFEGMIALDEDEPEVKLFAS